MTYKTIKTYGHEIGLSCCFRQHKAESHCRLLHGYALAVRLEFAADELDVRNWVVDYGSLKSVKEMLRDSFDHTLVVAEDDPMMRHFLNLDAIGVCRLVILPRVGCEAFAEYIYGAVSVWLGDAGYAPRCRLVSVQVSEHGANSAVYAPDLSQELAQ